jgi:hypothetical protein
MNKIQPNIQVLGRRTSIHIYIQTGRQHSKNHLLILRGPQNISICQNLQIKFFSET